MRTQIIDKSVVVSAIEGSVEIVLADGSSRPLQKGEILQPGAKLTIADDAELALSPYDGTPASGAPAGSESAEPAQPQVGASPEGAPSDIAALQESILQGVDPTQNFEASAAGGAPAAGGGGGIGGVAGASGNGGFVTIDRTGDATIAAAGFDTTYDTAAVINTNQAEDLILENQLDDLGETVVTQEDTQVSGNLLDNSTNPDGPAAASVVSYDWGINIGVPAGVAAIITGVGTLIINPDGSYTFTPAPNYDGTVSPINYQVTDGQDTVTSTLVISITPVDEEVGLEGLAQEGGEVLVSDANLADGSTPDTTVLTQGGVFTFNAPDGVQSLSVGGISLVSGGVAASLPQSIATPLGNTLTIIGYDAATGLVSYSYSLLDNEAHANAGGGNSLFEDFAVTLVDSDGDTANNTLSVQIVDDVPTAVNDVNPNTASENSVQLTGNVISNDVQGSDGAVVTAANLTGTYGSLVLNANGTYTYTLAPLDPQFVALTGGSTGSEVFTYTLTDADGDVSTATLTLAIKNDDDGVNITNLTPKGEGGDAIVHEDDLLANRGLNESAGSDTSKDSTTVTDSFNISAPDGVQTLSVGGISLVSGGVAASLPQSIATPLGNTLTIIGYDAATGLVSYSYSLLDNEAHANAGGGNSLFEDFAVTLVDSDGDTANNTLSVQIVDDVPTAVNDVNPNTASENSVQLTGNVISNDVQGSDGAVVTAANLTGTYGSLVLNANGTYTYTLAPLDPQFVALTGGSTGSEVFTYTLTDADGDVSTATLTLAIKNDDDGVNITNLTPKGEGGDAIVHEDDLLANRGLNESAGSDTSKDSTTVTDSFNISAPDGVQTLSVGGISLVSGGVAASLPQSIATPLGNTLTIIGYDAATGLVSYSYSLLDNEAHANAGGGNSLFEDFAVTLVDSDGDTANNTLSVQIVDDVPTAVNDVNPNTASENSVQLTGNVISNDVQGSDGAVVTAANLTGTYGSLVLNANGTYTYTLAPLDPQFVALTGGSTGSEVFTYTLTDADGDVSTATLTLAIKNDDDGVNITNLTPKGEGGDAIVHEDDLLANRGLNESAGSDTSKDSTTVTDSFNISAPDGVQTLSVGGISLVSGGVAASLPQSIATPLGNTLTIIGYDAATGLVSYSYSLLDNEAHANAGGGNSLFEDFAVTLVDSDGDTANNTLSVQIVDDVPTAVNDVNPNTASENSVQLTGNVISNDVQGSDGAVVTAANLTGTYGSLVLNANGTYTYTLAPLDPQFVALTGGSTGSEVFTYTLTDADGDVSTATLTLAIKNDDDGVNITNLTPKGEGGDAIVHEDDLLANRGLNESAGSDTSKDSTTVTDSFNISAPDGVQTLSVGGISLVSGGVAASLPQSIATPLGNTLTIIGYDAATGLVSYSYSLLDNEAHANAGGGNSLFEDFAVTLVDSDGDTANNTLSVQIVDDVPTAVNDVNPNTASENSVQLTGNVISNDVQGSDGAVVTAANLTGTYGSLVLNANGTYTYTLAPLDPQFVALTGGSTGSEVFTYTLTDADGDVSTATLTLAIKNDDDGVNITNLTPKGEGGDAIVHEDDLLANRGLNESAGSDTSKDSTTVTDSFNISAPDGVQTLSVGGISLVSGGVAASLPQSIATPLGNTLTIIGYDAATGLVSYSYSLLDNEAHANAGGGNSLFEDFAVTLVDSDGDTANNTLSVQIVDDVPTAVNDVNPNTASENSVQLTGNVISNDVQGSDGAVVTAANLTGTYGSLVLNANGTYTYTLAPLDPQFVALTGGSTGSEVFTYTLTDADGDVSTATLTLAIKNDDDGVNITNLTPKGEGGDAIVHEDDLLANRGLNESAGSDTSKDSTTVTDSFNISAPDGVQTLSVGGISLVSGGVAASLPQSIATPLGNTLTIIGYDAATGLVSYSYSLLDNEAHANAGGGNSLFEDFAVTLVDSDGDTANNTLSVQIVDDVPTAVNDVNPNTASENSVQLTGNVISNDVQGSDGAVVTAANLTGTYGSLVLNANGTYTYTLAPLDPQFVALTGGSTGSEVFTYTLTDADGDVSTATLTLAIKNDDDGVNITNLTPKGEGGDAIVHEDDLLANRGLNESAGSDTSKDSTTVTDSFNISAPDGVQTLSVGGISLVSGGVAASLPQSIATPLGNTLTIIGYDAATGLVSYSYSLLDNEAHANAGGGNSLFEDFAVTLVDSDGDTANNTLSVQIVDDVPTAVNDVNPNTASENSVQLTGNVISNDVQGSDGAVVTAANLTGTYGSLVLNANGTYTYTLAPLDPQFVALTGGSTGSEVFTYTLTDADGDVSTATLTLAIKNDDDGVNITNLTPKGEGGDAIVHEDDLLANRGLNESAGSDTSKDSTTVTDSFNISAPDGVQTLSVGGISLVSGGVAASLPQSIATPLGNTLTIIGYDAATGLVSYSYSLLDNEAHANAGGGNSLFEDFAVTLVDSDGDTANNTLSVQIVDDVPTAVNDVNPNTASENSVQLTGNVISNDVQGSDGAVVTAANLTGTYGSLVLNANGTYTYTLAPLDPQFVALTGGSTGSEVFTYTLTDADGDVSTATLTLAIKNDDDGVNITNLTPKGEGGDAIVHEDDLLANRGLNESAGSDTSKDSTTVTDSFNISAPDGVQTLSVGGISLVSGGVAASLPQSIATPLGNTLTIIGYDAATGLVSYSYSLLDNEAHANAGGGNSLFEDFAVTLVDSDGDTANNTLSVQIVDDVPIQPDVLNTRVEEFSNPGTNLMIILDTSGSMDYASGVVGYATRMAIARASIQQLISDYDDVGNVMVRLVGFASTATTNFLGSGDIWLTATQALNVINTITDTLGNGGTDYDDALIKAMSAYDSAGKIIGGQSVLYFLSDGEPTESSSWPGVAGSGSDGINGAEQATWQTFLTDNEIKAYALGMGTGATAPALEPISYNGASGAEQPAIIVTDLSQLASTLSGTVQVPTTGNLLVDAGVVFGADGPATLPITSISHDADGNPATPDVVYTTAYSGYNPVTHVLTIPTHGGGTFWVNLLTGDYSYSLSLDVADDYTETFHYTISDADGDVKTGVLNLITTDSSEVIVYDNSNEALVYEILELGDTSTTMLANFQTTTNGSGSGYNPWVYDTSGGNTTVIDLGGNTIASAIVNNGDKWIVSTQGGSTLDASVSSNELRLVDNNGTSAGGVEMLTPEFVTSASGTTTLSFDYDRANVNSNDVVTWSLYKFDGTSWVQQTGTGYSGFLSSDPGSTTSLTTGELEAGTRYRIHFSVLDGGGSGSNNDSSLELDDIRLNVTAAATTAIVIMAAQGNVLTDPNHNPNSSDPWGAVDALGSEVSVLKIWNGSSYSTVTTSQTVAGLYGTLEIHSDGDYTYTPNSNLSGVGQSDVFTYQVMQNDGDQDTAQLTINIGSTAAAALVPIEGTSGNDAFNGTVGNDVLLGHDGNDTIHGNGGSDHIEGGAGNDNLFGDAGNDVLLGGEGVDVLDGGIGDDTLIGGLGADTLTGGTDSDTFKWVTGDADGSTDTVTDFTLGSSASGGDVLDLSDLLVGVPTGSSNEDLATVLDNYLQFDTATNKLTIDTDGTPKGAQLTIQFQGGLDLDQGGTLTTNHDIIKQLLDDGNLKVDP